MHNSHVVCAAIWCDTAELTHFFIRTGFKADSFSVREIDQDLKALRMREIQEVGETTRPARAGALKGFETAFLDPLGKAIEAKDFKKFQAAFSAATEGCNGCHVSQGFAFIKYELPKAAPSPLKP